MKSVRYHYYSNHPIFHANDESALSEIAELNYIEESRHCTRREKEWMKARRKKLLRFLEDEEYHNYCVSRRVIDEEREEILHP